MKSKKRYLVTGGAGFIGSCFVIECINNSTAQVLNLDKLTYSGNLENLRAISKDTSHHFVRGDIGNAELVSNLLQDFKPDAIINFAAESHVDRSIVDPEIFVRSNVLGVCTMLRVTLEWWKNLPSEQAKDFRFLHISTDEVFGALQPGDPAFTESTPYAPNSPYSASKAASDHFVRAFHETYGLPVLITNCSNNYGPRQFPEKLIPLTILRCLSGQQIPIYGTGENIRDWLHVVDHCRAVQTVLDKGLPGETYNIGGNSELTNLEVVHSICAALDELRPDPSGPYSRLISFVKDRAGHDFRYAINCNKLETQLDWKPEYNFKDGLLETINWYLDNQEWLHSIQSGEYRNWVAMNYAQR